MQKYLESYINAEFFDLFRFHIGIAVQSLFAKSLALDCLCRTTRWRMSSGFSPTRFDESSVYFTAGTSTWISMRSSKGPEIFPTYF